MQYRNPSEEKYILFKKMYSDIFHDIIYQFTSL